MSQDKQEPLSLQFDQRLSRQSERNYEKEVQRRRGTIFTNFMDRFNGYDIFRIPVKSFNLQGRSEIGSLSGLIASVIVYLCVATYGIQKFHTLVYKKFPTVYSVTAKDVYDDSDVRSFNEMDFRIAFAVENYMTRESIDDSRFVEWDVAMVSNQDGEETRVPVDVRPCTDEDWNAFHPPAKKSKNGVKMIKERGSMFCIADYDQIKINGQSDLDNFSRLEMNLYPCKKETSPKCIHDEKRFKEYLGPLDFMLYYNNARFELEQYVEPIIKESLLKNTQVLDTPNFIHSELQENLLEDDSNWLTNGFTHEHSFTTFNIGTQQQSAYTRYPHEYKITGMEIMFSFDVI